MRRTEHAQELLRQIGMEPERVRMFNMSSAMAGGFVSAAQEMTEKIVELGPNPLRDESKVNSDE
jgi:coenzyme F420-reducing hydrogenase delta subunit